MSTERCIQCKTILRHDTHSTACHVCGSHVITRSDESWSKMQTSLRFLVVIAVVEIVLGAISIGCGVVTCIFARENLVWPMTSFAPIWTGILACSTGVLGASSWMQNRSPHNMRLRKLVIAHVTLCQFGVLLGGFNVAYGTWLLSACDTGRICHPKDGAMSQDVTVALSATIIAVGCAMIMVSGVTTTAACFCGRRLGFGSTSGSCY